MPTSLTVLEKQKIRNEIAKMFDPSWTKAQINAALDALDADFEDNIMGRWRNNTLENAAPGVFTNPQKRRLIRLWGKRRFGTRD